VLPRGRGVEVQLATVSDDEHTPIGHINGGDSIQGDLCEALLAPLEADAKVRLGLLLVAHLRFTAATKIDAASSTHTPRRKYGIATCHHGQSMWPVNFRPTNRTVRRTRRLVPPPAPEVPLLLLLLTPAPSLEPSRPRHARRTTVPCCVPTRASERPWSPPG